VHVRGAFNHALASRIANFVGDDGQRGRCVINYLRRKVDTGYHRALIRTIRGVGYQIGGRPGRRRSRPQPRLPCKPRINWSVELNRWSTARTSSWRRRNCRVHQRSDPSNILHQLGGNRVALRQILRRVVLQRDFPLESCENSTFSGKSKAAVGAATITGVPAFGLPKTSSIVGNMSSPAFLASPVKSIFANSVSPRAATTDSNRVMLSANVRGLATVSIPSHEPVGMSLDAPI